MQGKRIATIDVGTNTALLLISGWQDNKLDVLHDETQFVRLGEGVDEARLIHAAAMERLKSRLLHFKEVAEKWSVDEIIIGATSASRDAGNQQDLIDFVKRESGLTYGIITGEEEAHWSFAGVGAGLVASGSSKTSFISLDIGGGSTELTLGTVEGPATTNTAITNTATTITAAQSLDVGSVRLMEKFLDTQPPTNDQIQSAERWLNEQLDQLNPALFDDNAVLVGASGTTTVLGILENKEADIQQSSLGEISLQGIEQWAEDLLKMTEAEVLALEPRYMKGREDVFPAGLLILRTIMRRLNKSRVAINTWGLRHGLAIRYWNNPVRLQS